LCYNFFDRQTQKGGTGSPCFLNYKARRYKCKFCGKVFYEKNPFSYGKKQVSTYTILSVLEALRSHTSTFTSVAAQFNLTKQQVMGIFDEYVDCNRKRFRQSFVLMSSIRPPHTNMPVQFLIF
jgi:transposase